MGNTQQNKTINSQRKIELRNDEKYIHIMKYMGSKRELLPDIREEIDKISSEGEGVLDIFAGTGSVGVYLRDKYDVISNDVQSYSGVICDALISSCSHEIDFNKDLLSKIKKSFKKNRSALLEMFPKTVDKSRKFVITEKRGWTEEGRLKYIKFFESFPSPVNKFKTRSTELKRLYEQYLERECKANKFPYMQTTFLFSETYFSIEQCIDIDSIRYAIDKCLDGKIEKQIALAALVYAHSYCSSGTGHFAQFRDLKDVKSINDVFLYRDRCVWAYFIKKLEEIIEFQKYYPERDHLSVNMDYRELLNDKDIMKRVDVIYADPPYSFVHYSRFYHATESLIKYDYMLPAFKGRYRTDRHQSPFCQKQNVAKAFEYLYDAASKNRKKVILSYADTAMISLAELEEIATDKGLTFDAREIDYDHSTMGREGHKSNQIKEYLVTSTFRERQ
ncbi:DNA adenine methylase [Bacteriovorax sp. DB6_IX]|uniref:DNA adenine methylase n=1 Tax=Bacteriovorax sp. DB6_IX TaxID=1353530 RepID=UPI00038A2D8E|nr:DNA adenine methylase [Bacteriovorax sp. DB6_IX]EQC44459.1 D12 class N6 adenine-specific DNA methyltransferase domain protein [Bacteriovorax sp. DB6_IX]